MKIITEAFSEVHVPLKALLFYHNLSDDRDPRVEAFDINDYGEPVNAHPLTDNESKALAKSLSYSHSVYTGFLQYHGVLPTKVLYVDTSETGCAIWYTPAQKVRLFFKEQLTIPSGMAHIPPLVWNATSDSVSVYALNTHERPTDETTLFHAPFFNLYEDGKVCMGTVNIDVDEECNLLDFMTQWEEYFFNSYFSHTIFTAPHKGNLVSLWQQQVENQTPFPLDVLTPNGKTIKNIIVWNN